MDESKPIILVGYGRHAVSVISTLLSLNIQIKGYVDLKRKKNDSFGLEYLGDDAAYLAAPEQSLPHFCTLGNNQLREKVQFQYENNGLYFTNVIHPTAHLEQHVQLGRGIFIGAMAYINGLVKIGDGVILNNHTNVEHGCEIGSFSHLAPNVCLTGEVAIGDRAFLGCSSSVIPEKSIGADAIVGAGAVVIKNIAAGKTAIGIPAKVVK